MVPGPEPGVSGVCSCVTCLTVNVRIRRGSGRLPGYLAGRSRLINRYGQVSDAVRCGSGRSPVLLVVGTQLLIPPHAGVAGYRDMRTPLPTAGRPIRG
jgi:hypothetical protein